MKQAIIRLVKTIPNGIITSTEPESCSRIRLTGTLHVKHLSNSSIQILAKGRNYQAGTSVVEQKRLNHVLPDSLPDKELLTQLMDKRLLRNQLQAVFQELLLADSLSEITTTVKTQIIEFIQLLHSEATDQGMATLSDIAESLLSTYYTAQEDYKLILDALKGPEKKEENLDPDEDNDEYEQHNPDQIMFGKEFRNLIHEYEQHNPDQFMYANKFKSLNPAIFKQLIVVVQNKELTLSLVTPGCQCKFLIKMEM
ncbi:MAG TPA: hypothetical protein PLP14_11665 [Chitinophagaceae bacterium]|nr:hypothetical protein [Chitinophagaceae bacterium]